MIGPDNDMLSSKMRLVARRVSPLTMARRTFAAPGNSLARLPAKGQLSGSFAVPIEASLPANASGVIGKILVAPATFGREV